METLLEESVMDRLLEKLTHVKDFEVSKMFDLPTEVND